MPVRLGRVLVMASGLLLMGGLIAACGSGSEEGASPAEEGAAQDATIVNVVMVETWEKWGFALDRTEVPAGGVAFKVTNNGNFTHELMVYPAQDLSSMVMELVEAVWASDEAAHEDEEEGADEEDAHGEMIEGLVMTAEGEDELVLAPGQSGTFTVNLTPGSYGLACLIIETVGDQTFTHYEKGMHSTLTVQ